jgi:general secretion pathway protein A
MYTEHFGFLEDPFGVSPDPRFLYLGPVHHEAFAALLYGVKMRRGFMCLTGEPGTGKTTLLYALLERLEGSLRTVFLPGTDLTFKQRLQFIIESLGAKPAGGTVLSLTRQLQDLLAEEWRADSNVVLIFDEAQGLTVREMEDIRLLTNFETPQAKLLQVVLVGQPQLKAKLALPELSQLKQRITVNVSLRPLTLSETTEYIEHRLRVADWHKPLHTLFGRPVLAAIFEASRGIPRLINAVCHNALLIAYAENKYRVETAMIKEAAQELDLAEAAERAAQPEAVLPVEATEKHDQLEAEPISTPSASETRPTAPPRERPLIKAIERPAISRPVEPPSPVHEPVPAAPEPSRQVAQVANLRHPVHEPEISQRVEPWLELHEQTALASEPDEEDFALELGRELELTLEVSEATESWPETEHLEPSPVQVGEEAHASEPAPTVVLKTDAAEEPEPLVAVSQAKDLTPEIHEAAEAEPVASPEVSEEVQPIFASAPEISQEFEPAVDLDEEMALLPEMNEEAEFWLQASEEVQPAVDLDQEIGFLSGVSEEIEFGSETSRELEAAPGGRRIDLTLLPPAPEASQESEAVPEIVESEKLAPEEDQVAAPALNVDQLEAPGVKVGPESKVEIAEPDGVASEPVEVAEPVMEHREVEPSMKVSRQPEPVAISHEPEVAEPVVEVAEIEKPTEVMEEPEPVVFSYEPEPEPIALTAMPLPAISRRWLPVHPAGPSLNQLLDELEGFAWVREGGPKHRSTNGNHRALSSLPSLETLEPPAATSSQMDSSLDELSNLHIRHSMQPKRLSTAQMAAWVLFFVMVSLCSGVVIGIAVGHYWPDLATRFNSSANRQPKPQTAVNHSQPAAPAPNQEEVKSQPVAPPPPVMQPTTMPPLINREPPLGQSKIRTVILRRGDDLGRILQREYGYVNRRLIQQVQAANPQIKDWDHLEVGQKINLVIDPEEDTSPSRQGP